MSICFVIFILATILAISEVAKDVIREKNKINKLNHERKQKRDSEPN